MKFEKSTIRRMSDYVATLGESPVWNENDKSIYWVDIPGRCLLKTQTPNKATTRWDLPGEPSSLAIRENGDLILAVGKELCTFEIHTASLQTVAVVEPNDSLTRLNDGKAGPDGCFWVGSMDIRAISNIDKSRARLYRLHPDWSLSEVSDPIKSSNGLAFSPDERVAYHSDSKSGVVYRYHLVVDRDDTRKTVIGERELFATIETGWGRPDGAAMDEEGCYWSCGIDGSRINRFSPEGKLIGVHEVPFKYPTMCCFGGSDMATLFITSWRGESAYRYGVDDSPLAGCLVAFDVGVRGAAVARFAG